MKLNGAHQEMTGGVMVEDVITYYIYGVVARTCVGSAWVGEEILSHVLP